eukprot:6201161-Pleurochrysis_carterae.AAC.7
MRSRCMVNNLCSCSWVLSIRSLQHAVVDIRCLRNVQATGFRLTRDYKKKKENGSDEGFERVDGQFVFAGPISKLLHQAMHSGGRHHGQAHSMFCSFRCCGYLRFPFMS